MLSFLKLPKENGLGSRAGRKGIFPEATHDPIIQIANMVTRQGLLYATRIFFS